MVRDNPEVNKRVSDTTALGRAGVPDDIGPMIAALLWDENRWVSGNLPGSPPNERQPFSHGNDRRQGCRRPERSPIGRQPGGAFNQGREADD